MAILAENAIVVVLRRHSTTSLSKNVLVAETSYQVLEVSPLCDPSV